MKIATKSSYVIGLLGMFIAYGSLCIYAGNELSAQEIKSAHQQAPREAYRACEGKSEGDTAEFVGPHGDMVTGTCVQEHDRLVLHPDNLPEEKEVKGYAVVDTGQLGCYDDHGELVTCPSEGEPFYGQVKGSNLLLTLI